MIDRQAAPTKVSSSDVGYGEANTRDPWIHRATGMRCATCMWFVGKPARIDGPQIKDTEVGRCRRHAPTMGGYPVVYLTDWCGDHRLDENKI